jgi:hypothetical protein
LTKISGDVQFVFEYKSDNMSISFNCRFRTYRNCHENENWTCLLLHLTGFMRCPSGHRHPIFIVFSKNYLDKSLSNHPVYSESFMGFCLAQIEAWIFYYVDPLAWNSSKVLDSHENERISYYGTSSTYYFYNCRTIFCCLVLVKGMRSR